MLYELKDYLTSDNKYPERVNSDELTPEKLKNAAALLDALNEMFEFLKMPRRAINSGFRTLAANTAAGGATHSNHMDCTAIDLADPTRSLYWLLCASNNALLLDYDFFIEHIDNVPRTHIQTKATKNRVFLK
jgi:hypothetical protein